MVSAGRGDYSRPRDGLSQQICDRAARLERSSVLQQLQLQSQRSGLQSELRCIHGNHRRAANVRSEFRIEFPNLLASNGKAVLWVFHDRLSLYFGI